MPVKIRLARNGKKGSAHYSIVIADSRAPRDGKFVEKIGTYNPNTNPATIDICFDRALYWLQTGAQPTDTCRSILSYKGILLKDHLLRGVKKGALTQEQAEAKFESWMKEKETKIEKKKESIESKTKKEFVKKIEAEVKASEKRALEIAKKRKEKEDAEKEEVVDNQENNEITTDEVKE